MQNVLIQKKEQNKNPSNTVGHPYTLTTHGHLKIALCFLKRREGEGKQIPFYK